MKPLERARAKAVFFLILSTLVVFGFAQILTDRLDIALAIGGLDLATKALFYYGWYERTGKKSQSAGKKIEPFVLWFTGLSGAGKTTLSLRVVQEMKKRGHFVEHLDGDTVRDLFPSTGFSREERNEHIKRVGLLASCLERHGIFVVASLISPYAESRNFVRGLCKNFVEVYVSTPLETCEARDVKGLYARARKGEVRNFTGIDSEYEPPTNPDLRVDTTANSEDAVVKQIMKHLEG